MNILNWSHAIDPATKKSVLLYLNNMPMDSCDDPTRCAFFFDVDRPRLFGGADYPTPVRDFNKFAIVLGYPEPTKALSKDRRLGQKMDFCAYELLRRYVNGTEIPPDGECGIERHFREHPEEINA